MKRAVASLRGTSSDAELDALRAELDALRARIQRLETQLVREERTTEQLNAVKSVAKNLAKLQREREQASLDVGRLDYEAADIYLRVPTPATLRRLRSCRKEPWTVRWIEEWIRPAQTLYDVGANVGAYSLVAASVTEGQATVVALEPGYATFAILCENIVLNDVADSVIPLPIALSDRTALATLTYSDLMAGRALHTVARDRNTASIYAQPILSYSLDELIRHFDLPAPNHIKLDVDGAEARVLAGAKEALAAPHLQSVLAEVHPDEAEAIDEALASAGLRQVEEYRPAPKPGRRPPLHSYRLYARGEKPEADRSG